MGCGSSKLKDSIIEAVEKEAVKIIEDDILPVAEKMIKEKVKSLAED